MMRSNKISGPARPWGRTLLVVAVSALGLVAGSQRSASAEPVTYSATVTVPAPPASNFAGASGGGDGWAVGLTSTQVFNVFHHNGSVVVNCHNQSDATTCWNSPKVVVDGTGGGFSNSIGPGLYVDQGTGLMYTPAVRNADKVAGIVCIDTTKPTAATGAELFCGFTALTGANESQGQFLSAPVQIGSRWYTFNEWVGAPTSAGQDALLCFDLNTKAACAGQPFAVDRGGIDFQGYTYSFPIAAVGTRVVMQLFGGAGSGLACFDTATSAKCSGTWPVTVGSSNGPPLPLLNANAQVVGVCSSNGTVPCFNLSGASTPTPVGFAAAMAVNEVYGSAASVIGPRIYITHPSPNQVACWDFAQAATCTNFPKTLSNLSLLYSTNPDPARPGCLWVNADSGASQIQNFDAFTGGPCGVGVIRVLTSSIVVPSDQCIPASYTSLQVLTPPRSGYSTGDIDFQDQSGTPIAGVPQHHLDGTGTTSLSDLNLATTTPLPQFLISLNNPTSAIGSVQVKLVWTGQASPSCVGPGIVTSQATPTLATQASPGNLLGAPVRDTATVSGGSSPSGSVTFQLFSDAGCATQVFSSTNPLGAGTATSDTFTPTAAGTYRFIASYSGDANNNPVTSACGAANESVAIAPFAPPAPTRTVTGDFLGPLPVNAGQSVVITNARVVGPVTVNPGGSLTVVNSQISQGIVANAPSFFSVCGSQVSAPSTTPSQGIVVSGAAVPIRIGDPANGCAFNRVAGDVSLTGNTAGLTLGANIVSGNVTVNNNTVGTDVVKANNIFKALACAGNSPAPTNAGQTNTAASKSGQCASL